MLTRRTKDGTVTIHRGYFHALPGPTRQALNRLRQKDGRIQSRLATKNEDIFVIYAERDGEVMGWINWLYQPRDAKGKFVDRTRLTYVSRNHRRKGIGTILTKEAIRYLTDNHNQAPNFNRRAAGNFLSHLAPDFYGTLIDTSRQREPSKKIMVDSTAEAVVDY